MTLIVFSASMLLLFVAGCHAQLTSSTCQAVPKVPGVNQEPSDPTKYGKCTGALDSHVVSTGSNWCAFNGMGYWPAGPAPKAKQCLKFGRMTVYRGPIYGSQPDHKGACNATLVGSNESSVVAVSTKYLKTAQGGWVADKGACGQCMCIHVRGVDDKYNPGVKYQSAKAHFGLTFLAKVSSRNCYRRRLIWQQEPAALLSTHPVSNSHSMALVDHHYSNISMTLIMPTAGLKLHVVSVSKSFQS